VLCASYRRLWIYALEMSLSQLSKEKEEVMPKPWKPNQYPMLMTMRLPDLESLLSKCVRDANPNEPSDKVFMQELCQEIHHRQQHPIRMEELA